MTEAIWATKPVYHLTLCSKVHRPFQEPRKHWDRHGASRTPAPAPCPGKHRTKSSFRRRGSKLHWVAGGVTQARSWRPALQSLSEAARLKGALGSTLFGLWLAGRKGRGWAEETLDSPCRLESGVVPDHCVQQAAFSSGRGGPRLPSPSLHIWWAGHTTAGRSGCGLRPAS